MIYLVRKIRAAKIAPTVEVELNEKKEEPEILVGPELSGETQVTYISSVSVHTPNWDFDNENDVECPGTSLRSLRYEEGKAVEIEIRVNEPALSSRPEFDRDIKPVDPEYECNVPEGESVIGDNTMGTPTPRTEARTEPLPSITVRA